MSHWFDDLTVSLTGHPEVSRRQALGGILAGVLAPSWMRNRSQTARRPGRDSGSEAGLAHAPVAGPCTRQTTSGGGFVSQVSMADGQLTFQQTLSVLADGTHTTSIIVKNGTATVWKSNTTGTKARAGTATATYGAAVTGARVQSLKTEDGKRFTGVLDGRAFTMESNARSIASGTFEDGHRAATIQVDSALKTRIATLGAKSMAKLATCTNPAKPILKTVALHQQSQHLVTRARPTALKEHAVATNSHFDTPSHLGEGPIGAVQGQTRGDGSDSGWNSPGHTYVAGETADSPACDQCYTDATNTARQDSGLDSIEGWIAAIADAGASLIAFNIEAAVLIGVCNLPGNKCYPVACGGPFEACAGGDQCVSAGICCATGTSHNTTGPVCNNVCCGEGVTGCASDGYCGCPSGLNECGDQCCPPGSKCCGGYCYTTGTECCGNDLPCLGGTHCLTGSKGSMCCFNESLCLNAYCCGLDTCTKDGCCQQEQVCGDACCPPGEICQNGSCFKPPCASNVAWCNGQCCPAASDAHGTIMCCTPHTMDVAPYNNMNAGCHHTNVCVTVPR